MIIIIESSSIIITLNYYSANNNNKKIIIKKIIIRLAPHLGDMTFPDAQALHRGREVQSGDERVSAVGVGDKVFAVLVDRRQPVGRQTHDPG